MDQNYNTEHEFFWNLLANPADEAHKYQDNLQKLVDEYPQSGILHALLARATDGQNLKQAAAYFSPKSLYKLINAPSSFAVVTSESIINTPALYNNSFYEPTEHVAESETLGIAEHRDSEPNVTENDYNEQEIVEPIGEDPELAIDDPGQIHEIVEHTTTEEETDDEQLTETAKATHEPTIDDLETATAETGQEEGAAITEDAIGDSQPVEDNVEKHTSSSEEQPKAEEPAEISERETNTSEEVSGHAEEPVTNRQLEESTEIETKPEQTEEAGTQNEEPVTEEHVEEAAENEPVSEESNPVAENGTEEPALINENHGELAEVTDEGHEETPSGEEQELAYETEPKSGGEPAEENTYDEITGIDDIHISKDAVSYEHIEAPITADNNSANYFMPDVEFGEYQRNVEEEAIASATESQTTGQTGFSIADSIEQSDLSKYHDEKMPYSFMWWLDKTRKEHAGVYQPYLKTETGIGIGEANTTGGELQHQYYENIFHITSIEELDKTTPPYAPVAQPKRKEQIIIDRFIHEEPTIKPQSSEKLDNENKAKKSSEDRDELVTETLAAIYTEQMLYHKAIAAYKKLILKIPEKSSYFADKIEQLEKKTN